MIQVTLSEQYKSKLLKNKTKLSLYLNSLYNALRFMQKLLRRSAYIAADIEPRMHKFLPPELIASNYLDSSTTCISHASLKPLAKTSPAPVVLNLSKSHAEVVTA